MSEAIFAWNFTLISLYAKQPISCCLSAMFSVNSRAKYILHANFIALIRKHAKILIYYGSVALLWHYTSSVVRFLELVFLHGAGGPGNPCYGVQSCLVNFALHFQKC